MKKAICVFLILCLCSSQILGNQVEKKYDTWVIIPAIATMVASVYFAQNPPIWYDTYKYLEVEYTFPDGTFAHHIGPNRYKNYTPAWICGILSVFFICVAITPRVSSDGETTYIKTDFKF